MKAHPYADLFPLMNETEYAALKADITENGLKEPIIIYNDCILDGRNRWRACMETGTKPITQNYFGKDPVGYVVSKNLHRRHLNESQRAMVAAELVKLGKQRSNDDGPIGPTRLLANSAQVMNASETSTKRAIKVVEAGDPELIERVKAGQVRVSKAAASLQSLPNKRSIMKTTPYQQCIKLLDKLTLDELKGIGIYTADLIERRTK